MAEMYKRAGRLKLRFTGPKGRLSVEDLWDIDLKTLDLMAVAAAGDVEAQGSVKSFLEQKDDRDLSIKKLKADILLDVLQSRVAQQKANEKAQETRKRNQTIMAIIAKKEGEALEGMSIEELKAQLT